VSDKKKRQQYAYRPVFIVERAKQIDHNDECRTLHKYPCDFIVKSESPFFIDELSVSCGNKIQSEKTNQSCDKHNYFDGTIQEIRHTRSIGVFFILIKPYLHKYDVLF